jgi:hypothetical protein
VFFWQGDIYRDSNSGSEEWFVHGASGPQLLISSGSGYLVGFDTDGRQYVWCIGYGWTEGSPIIPRAEIWLAPFTTDPAELRPRLLLSIEQISLTGTHAIGDGYYVVGSMTGGWYVVDMANGAYWRIVAPVGTDIVVPLFVNRREVGFKIRASSEVGCYRQIRISLESLGTPYHSMP